MASIRKRGDLQWEARVRRRGWSLQSKTFETKAAAEAWARQTEGEMDRGVFLSRAESENTTLAEALERYAREITPKKRSAQREAYLIAALLRRPLAGRYLATIRSKDIADFIRERGCEDVAANTIRLDLALLSHVFETCRSTWGMENLTNPVPLARSAAPRLPPGRNRRFREGEEARLLAACPSMLAQVVRFAIETAMRRGEIAALQWGDVDLNKKTAHLSQTKNGDARTVPLSSAALSVLRALPRRLDGAVFGMSENAITLAFRRTTAEAGIQGLTFHDLRHEATSRLFEKGFNPMEVSAITGHKTLQMLKRYTHLRPEDLAARLG